MSSNASTNTAWSGSTATRATGINGILGGFHEHGEDIEFDEDAKRLSLQTLTLAELLQRHAPDWEAPRLQGRALVHGHCHQEAVMGMSAEKELYERLGLDFEVLDSGCCGLAGSFGIAMALPRHR